MKRPKQTGANRRTVMLRLRVSVAEKAMLLARSKQAGLTISDWIRSKAIDSKPVIKKAAPDIEIFIRILAALGKCGSNLNQVARQLNRKQENLEFEVPLEVIGHLTKEFKEISEHLRETLHGNRKG